MSRSIARLLGRPPAEVSRLLGKLESKNGWPSHDVRHLSDNLQRVRRKLTELGLDPDDTSAEELYQALLTKFQSDSRRFDEHFGVYGAAYDRKIQKAADLINQNCALPERWVLKTSAAKALLRRHQPKHVMKQLHYRSIESMLKRESLAELYLAVIFMESPFWNRTHAKLVSSSDSTVFEQRRLKVVGLSPAKWGSGPDVNVLFDDDSGALAVEPTTLMGQASLLSLTTLLLDKLAELGGVKVSDAAGFSPAAAWWSDMDGLVADLDGQPVSLNLKDVAADQTMGSGFEKRSADAGRHSFWRQLLDRYENQLAAEEDLESELNSLGGLAIPHRQPAFEFAEDI